MFHAISARLARLARRIRSRLAALFEYGIWYGGQTPGTWQLRDPRSGQSATACTTPSGSTPASRTWAQDAIAGRIRDLGPVQHGTGKSRIYRKVLADLGDQDQVAVVDGKSDRRWPR